MTESGQTMPNIKIRDVKELCQNVFTDVLWAMDTWLTNARTYIRCPESMHSELDPNHK